MLGKRLKIALAWLGLILTGFAQTIPAGMHISVRIGQEISSGTANVGDRLDATLARHLAERSSPKLALRARGRVYAGEVERQAACARTDFCATHLDPGRREDEIPIFTGSYHLEGKCHAKSNATKTGGGRQSGR